MKQHISRASSNSILLDCCEQRKYVLKLGISLPQLPRKSAHEIHVFGRTDVYATATFKAQPFFSPTLRSRELSTINGVPKMWGRLSFDRWLPLVRLRRGLRFR